MVSNKTEPGTIFWLQLRFHFLTENLLDRRRRRDGWGQPRTLHCPAAKTRFSSHLLSRAVVVSPPKLTAFQQYKSEEVIGSSRSPACAAAPTCTQKWGDSLINTCGSLHTLYSANLWNRYYKTHSAPYTHCDKFTSLFRIYIGCKVRVKN